MLKKSANKNQKQAKGGGQRNHERVVGELSNAQAGEVLGAKRHEREENGLVRRIDAATLNKRLKFNKRRVQMVCVCM